MGVAGSKVKSCSEPVETQVGGPRRGVLMSHVNFKKWQCHMFVSVAGLPTVPYFTVQYRIFTLVPSVPYGTENVPFFLAMTSF